LSRLDQLNTRPNLWQWLCLDLAHRGLTLNKA
jgi:hypothetical protein